MNGHPGNVAIYSGAKGTPTHYTAPGFFTYDWCAYDGSGNLYIDGSGLAEMPYATQTLNAIALDVTGAGIHWDGQNLAMLDPTNKQLYRIAISGSAGTVVGTVKFSGLFKALGDDFALSGDNVVVSFSGRKPFFSKIGLWKYPKGGRLQRSIHQVKFFTDLTLSI